MSSLTQRVALVTGGNKGLGFEIARQLAQQDIIVVIGARSATKGEDAAAKLRAEKLDATHVVLDTAQADQIAALPDFFRRRFGRLDILINNAGVKYDTPPNVEQLRETLDVNFIAPFAIIEALLPLLKESPAGRIVNHSSGLGSLQRISSQIAPDRLRLGYSASKAALNVLTVVLARQFADTRIKVNSAAPGWVKTQMGGPGAVLEIPEGARTAVALATFPDDGPTGGFYHQGEVVPW